METTLALDLGTWLGKRQAFDLIAKKCSAADAECLKKMREQAAYQKLDLTWDQFCQQHLGFSRSYADRIIQHLDEFGESYFKLAEIMQISATTYRQIAGAVDGQHIEFRGEKIPIVPENAPRIAQAVAEFRREAAEANASLAAARAAEAAETSAPCDVKRVDRSLVSSSHRFDAWLADLTELAHSTRGTEHFPAVERMVTTRIAPRIQEFLKTFGQEADG